MVPSNPKSATSKESTKDMIKKDPNREGGEAPTTRFGEFELPPQLERALAAMEFKTPTPIQAEAIPIALSGMDIIGCAQTGTGKTAAFSIPLFARLMRSENEKALILVPTRELAEQVTEVLQNLAKYYARLRPALIIGGASMAKQIGWLARNPRIIVGTPGRIMDHIGRRSLALDQVGVLVLDEADRMLDMGFAPQINKIMQFVPTKRQTLLFSATLPNNIMDLAKRILKSPARVSVDEGQVAAPLIEQSVVEVEVKEKNDALLDEVNQRKGSMLVFVRTKSRAERVCDYLESYGVAVERMHGGRSQAQRRRALELFKDGKARVLVATDVVSRGIDVTHVAHVVNFDLPMDPEDYVHRIGRTGRNGQAGQAVSFVTPEDRKIWGAILRLLGKDSERSRGGGKSHSGGGRYARGPQGGDRGLCGGEQRSARGERSARSGRDEGRRGDSRRSEGGRPSFGEGRGFAGKKRGEGREEGRRHEGGWAEGRSFERGEKRESKRADSRGEGSRGPRSEFKPRGRGGPKGPRAGASGRGHGQPRRGGKPAGHKSGFSARA